jgi:hypothetical protein
MLAIGLMPMDEIAGQDRIDISALQNCNEVANGKGSMPLRVEHDLAAGGIEHGRI